MHNRQIPIIGAEGQKKLKESKIAVIGLGGLGSVAANLLARAGVGKLLLIDNDIVEECNLQRQFYRQEDLGKSKGLAAFEKLKEFTTVEYKVISLDKKNINIIKNYDLVLDCTDNSKTKFILNDYCKKPWIYASAIKTYGYVMPILPGKPCLRCFLKEAEMESCDTAGVLNTITVNIASLQTNLALQILTGKKVEPLLFYHNIWTSEFKKLKIKKRCENCLNP